MPVTAKTPKPAAKAAAKAAPKAAKKPRSALGKLLSGKKAPAKAGPAIGLVELPVAALWPSPLNPRKVFDPEAINELAASIKADGQVYQNLVARANPGPDGATHEIIAGERRYRSVSQLIAEGAWDAAQAVPVRIIEADDAKFIEIATLENMQRRDLTPLEEARAFGQLRDLGRTTDQIAEAVGMSLRHVQVRLQLVDTLTPAGQGAMERGDISLAQARALTLEKDPELQEKVLDLVLDEQYWGGLETPEEIRAHILAQCAPTTAAIFPIEHYTGEFVVDVDDEEVRYFKDEAQFEELQLAAVKELEKTLKAQCAWVNVVRGYYYSLNFEDCEDTSRNDVGAVIHVDHDLSVKVHERLVKRSSSNAGAASSAGTAAPTPQPEFTQKHLIYAHNKKTAVLQGAVAKHPRTAKILACLALMGGQKSVLITAKPKGHDDRVVAGSVIDGLSEIAETLPPTLFGKDRKSDPVKLAGEYSVSAETEAEAYEALKGLDDAALDRLFTGLVARSVGTFNDYGSGSGRGDPPLVCALAKDLDIDMTRHWLMDDDYLALPKKPRLLEIIEAGSPSGDADTKADREKMTAKQLRTAITLRGKMVLPREMQFGTEAELNKAKAINFGPVETVTTTEAAE